MQFATPCGPCKRNVNSTKVEYLGRAETAKVLGCRKRTVLDYGQKGKLKTAAGVDPARQATLRPSFTPATSSG